MKWSQSVVALRLLIQLIGTSYRPSSLDDESEESRGYSPEMGAADQVKHDIKALATITCSDATGAIQTLMPDENLRPCRARLEDVAKPNRPG